MDILDIDEVLKDDSFLCFEGKTHDDVVNILRQWKQGNKPPLLRGLSNDDQQKQQQAAIIAEHRNYGQEKINTTTFTRPKRKIYITLDVNKQTLPDIGCFNLQESIMKPKIGGYMTATSMLQNISPPSSISFMTPLIHKSMLQDTSPPASICSSIDKSIDNSLISSADFSSISFLQTPNCYTLQDMLSDRHKLELLTQSSDDGTLLKDINIGQIDDISLQSKQTSSCSTMANSTDSMEATIIYTANEQTFEVDTLKNNDTFDLQLTKKEQTTNVMEQTVCLSNIHLHEFSVATKSPDSFCNQSYACKISTPLQDRSQRLSVELSPIDKSDLPQTPTRHGNTFDMPTTPISHLVDEQSMENEIETELQALQNNLTFRHKNNELNAKRSAFLTQHYNEEELEQQLEDLEKICLSKEEVRVKQPLASLKKLLNVNSDESCSPQRGHNTSHERLLSRRSRLYDDLNLSAAKSNETLNINGTSFTINKHEEETRAEVRNEEKPERLDRRQQSRNRFKTIKLTKTRGENVPCIDDYEFEQPATQEERVPQQEKYYENNRQISKMYRKYDANSSEKKENLYARPSQLRGLYDFSVEKANSAHNLDATEMNGSVLQRERAKSKEKTSPLGLKSKSYTNLTKPELTIRSITPKKYQQVVDTEQFTDNTADNTFKIMRPVSGLRVPCAIRPTSRASIYNKIPASGKSDLQEQDTTFCFARPNGITMKLPKNQVSGIPKPPTSRLPSAVKRSGLPRPTSTTRR